MELSVEELKVKNDAIAFAREQKDKIAQDFTDPVKYSKEDNPVSVFMAGSPGAGKTEASRGLLEDPKFSSIIRIDPDDLRSQFDSYTGSNSYLFQGAVSILVSRIHDYALKQKQSFIFDGTLSQYNQAKKNILRSLSSKRNRPVYILYVYQDPLQAWKFVLKREEKRRKAHQEE